jgi:hypothetical protein
MTHVLCLTVYSFTGFVATEEGEWTRQNYYAVRTFPVFTFSDTFMFGNSISEHLQSEQIPSVT